MLLTIRETIRHPFPKNWSRRNLLSRYAWRKKIVRFELLALRERLMEQHACDIFNVEDDGDALSITISGNFEARELRPWERRWLRGRIRNKEAKAGVDLDRPDVDDPFDEGED